MTKLSDLEKQRTAALGARGRIAGEIINAERGDAEAQKQLVRLGRELGLADRRIAQLDAQIANHPDNK